MAANSLFRECERFLRQAEMIVPISHELSLTECRDFLARAATLLRTSDEDVFTASKSFLIEAERLLGPDHSLSFDECQVFLIQAENLLPPPQPSLEDCRAFLEMIEGHLLEHWRRRIDLLREMDPRDRPDFQTVNLFDILGISRQEVPHSRFLGWLLDPQESHSLGTIFLDSFLQLVQRACGREFEANLRDVEVKLERGTDKGVPDITVIGSNFLCIVENKILAVEGLNQTQRYADAAEEEARQRRIPPTHLLLVFLSPTGHPSKDNRFHALAYPPLLHLLEEDILSRDIPPIVQVAIRQFVFNLRARILHEYDNELVACVHLDGYAENGDIYLREYGVEIERTFQEVNGMSGFKGFSDISKLYADKYDLVHAMKKAFEDERKQLFTDLQNRIAKAPWFDGTRNTLHQVPSSVEIRLQDPISKENLVRVQAYLDASRFGKREFYSDLRLIVNVPDIRLFKRRFEQAASQQLLDALNVEDYKSSRPTDYTLVSRDVPFEPDTILDAMLEEVGMLQQFFPHVEQVYLDLMQGEEEN